eukprot:gene14897-6037_t
MKLAGIDTNVFTAPSCRSASTSAAKASGLSLREISKSAEFGDKLAKIRPRIDVVTQQCCKVELKEYHAADEQAIPWKTSPVKARRSSQAAFNPHHRCFFCENQDEPQNLHSASTIEIDKNVRESSILLNDRKIIAKLAAGDLIAIEAKYHAKYLVAFYNRARPLKQKSTKSVGDDKDSIDVKELAFAELLSYIEDRLENEKPAILTLLDLVSFYTFKLKELGADSRTVHATRLKERVLSACPDLSAHAEGRDIRLVLRSEIEGILSDVKRTDTDAWTVYFDDRFLTLSTEIANSVIERYEREDVVCPAKLRSDVFCTAAVDNIDHNTSSITPKGSFHRTAISIVQHSSTDNGGTPRSPDVFEFVKPSNSKTISQLPPSYSEVLPVLLPADELYAPVVQEKLFESDDCLNCNSEYHEEDWLRNALALFEKGKISDKDFVSWAAYRAFRSVP